MEILLAMAVVPAAVLLWYVYKVDPIEKEPLNLLVRLLGFGALACIPAVILEEIGTTVLLGGVSSAYTVAALLVENFVVVAVSEEACKYLFLRLKTWKNPAFDYVFDGVVYAVYVSLGFAILENIGYVFEYGPATALVRAFTAIPGHAIFGVFMGCFYGLAKRADLAGQGGKRAGFTVLALVVPMFCHGLYDFLASVDGTYAELAFFAFLILLMVVAMRLVKHMARLASTIQVDPYTARGEAGLPFDPIVVGATGQAYVPVSQVLMSQPGAGTTQVSRGYQQAPQAPQDYQQPQQPAGPFDPTQGR